MAITVWEMLAFTLQFLCCIKILKLIALIKTNLKLLTAQTP